MDRPVGKVSEKWTLEIAVDPGLLIANERVDVPPGLIVLGEKDLARLALMILA